MILTKKTKLAEIYRVGFIFFVAWISGTWLIIPPDPLVDERNEIYKFTIES